MNEQTSTRKHTLRGHLAGLSLILIMVACAQEPSNKEAMHEIRIDSCEYLIGLGPEMLMGPRTVHIITHKANCDNHGSKP
jgi:hypothetical protein